MTAWHSACFMLRTYRKLQVGGGKAENSCKLTSYATRVVFRKLRFPFTFWLWRVLWLFGSVISSVAATEGKVSQRYILKNHPGLGEMESNIRALFVYLLSLEKRSKGIISISQKNVLLQSDRTLSLHCYISTVSKSLLYELGE